MSSIRVERTIDSTTLEIPELSGFMGQTVEIVVQSAVSAAADSEADRWKRLEAAAKRLRDYDFGAVDDQAAIDLQHAGDHLR